ncbi:YlzJ-like family protein [Candidatus Desulforudis audaxviator]|uniref:YlzJ-like protein n=1 Tax=Desulforudis audaxviator (strain MP104C) TaxID=477974 RepID=B1I2Y4_DESAP|nr:YlzJ-like family protein [Candidatus Desulforudis audaxviator]ACA59345.1 hypothetical protein Daud_0830 [Candidatus Desulforudis audaxviator MP104C]AZK59318.1 hypothetical protein Daudx_0765 [Candidatus Desulforudis audaxviator]
MILYTVLDIESVLGEPAGAEGVLENAVVDGVPVLVRRSKAGNVFLERVLSTDPYDFLRPELTPGSTLYL